MRASCITFLCGILYAAVSAAAPDVYVVNSITDDYFGGGYPTAAPVVGTEIDVTLTPGEYEPASFVLRADKSREAITIEASALSDAAGNALAGAEVDIRVVKAWYQRSFGGYAPSRYKFMTSELLVYDDELIRVADKTNYLRLTNGDEREISATNNLKGALTPDIDEFPVRDATELQPISLADGESRQFWVTVRVPDDASPGDYAGNISIMQGEEQLVALPLTVEVLPFRLARPILEYGIYYRGQLDKQRPDGSVSSEVKSKAQMLADFRNLAAHGIDNPIIYQSWRSGQLEDVLKLRQAAGLQAENLYTLSVNIVPNNDGVITSRLGEQVQEVILLAEDYDYTQVYFYARDEARGEDLLYQVPFWNQVRRYGGKIMAAGWPQTAMYPGNFNTTGGEEDLYVSLGTLSRAEAERWHGKGRRIFSYQNPTGGYELPLSWRRNYGLLLWQKDYDGAFPYAWQHSFGDGWNDFDHHRYRDHMFTYPAVDKPIDTVQWEAFREGVDDVRYLSTLLGIMETEDAKASPYYSNAEQWLAALRELPLAQADLDRIRKEMVSLILALSGYVESDENDLQTSKPEPQPAGPNGQMRLEWVTSKRVLSCVTFNDERICGLPATKEHSVAIPAKDVSRDFSVQPISAEPDGNDLLLSLDVQSSWRSSIGIDSRRSLLGWWRFSEQGDDIKDLSSYGHDGELKGNASYGKGWIGQGVELRGDGGFVNFSDIEIPENGSGAIEGWFRFNSFAKDRVKNMALWSGMYQHGDNNHFYFNRTNEHFQVGALLSRDTWHHIALTWNGDTSSARMYVDGHYVPISIQRNVENISAIDGLTIGRKAGYLGGLVGRSSNTFDGAVDEVRVWNRELSVSEVRASWQAGAGRLEIRVDGEGGAGNDWEVFGVNAAGQELMR